MASNDVYTGFWINRNKEGLRGVTWTLSLTNANILNSFLTFIITAFLFASLWKLLIFSLYIARPVPSVRRNASAQHWVILRNSGGPEATAIQLVQSLFGRKGEDKQVRSVILLLIPSFVLLVLKIVGSLIPALIISGSHDQLALSNPGVCGFNTLHLVTDPDAGMIGAAAANELLETTDSRRYATERYANSSTTFITEPIFPIDSLPFEVQQNAPCPFDKEMCLLGADSAVSFDTGLLDSHTHLGINAPVHERIQYRWSSVCAPLNISDKVNVLANQTYDGIPISGLEPVLEINLGPLNSVDKTYTFLYKQNLLDASSYKVRSVSAIGGGQNQFNIWTPIDSLNRPDADVTLVLIGTNAVTYARQVSDPVFQANKTTIGSDLWISDYTVRIVACADQHQFCNPMTGDCTALNRSSGQWSSPFVQDGASPQFATGWRLSQYTSQHLIDHNVRSLGQNALIANSLVPDYTFISPGLPSNQWQREAQRWFETGLAKFQYHAMAFPNISLPESSVPMSSASSGIKLAQDLTNIPDVNRILASQCGNQLVRLRGRGQNVSVLGLVVLLVVAVIVPVVTELLVWWADRPTKKQGRRWRWQRDQFLELWRTGRRLQEAKMPVAKEECSLLVK